VARHEVEALTVLPNDAPALAAAIRRLLDDDALAERLGAAGLARAQAQYHLGRFVSEMKQVFDATYRARLARGG
jgi:glycosyltransferase involved in cell wall biosynthesis